MDEPARQEQGQHTVAVQPKPGFLVRILLTVTFTADLWQRATFLEGRLCLLVARVLHATNAA
jgi:hypothetical protein